MQQQPYNRLVHMLALVTAAATFPLIFMGGLVTSHGAGMSVPDWPNTWGYNMFLFPPSKWVGGIFYEHTHRLLATLVGLLSIILTITAFRTDSRKWLRWLSVSVFLAVCIQGVLGGLRVVLSDRDLAMVHGCAAQVLFCFIGVVCVLTSPFWSRRQSLALRTEQSALRKTFTISILAVSLIFAQLIVGAIMRHSDAGLAIPDLPASFGHILPPTHLDAAFRAEAIRTFGTDLGLNRVTLFQIWIHFSHRIGAILVSAAVIWLCTMILLRLRRQRALVWPAALLLLLLVGQLTLGVLTVLLRKPADIASLHVAVGSLVLLTTCVIGLRAYGLIHAESGRTKSVDAMPAARPFNVTGRMSSIAERN